MNYLNLKTTDPAFNLAVEEYVFDYLPRDRMYVMLWQNDNAIIIGKALFIINNTSKIVCENPIDSLGNYHKIPFFKVIEVCSNLIICTPTHHNDVLLKHCFYKALSGNAINFRAY